MAKLNKKWDAIDEEAERQGIADIAYRQSRKHGVGRGYKLVASQRMQEAGAMKHEKRVIGRYLQPAKKVVIKGKVNLRSW